MAKIKRQLEQGASKLTTAVFGLIIAVVLYVGYNVLPFYYYYYELLNQFEAAIRVASLYSDQEIRQKLMYHIKKMEIPCQPQDLKIIRTGQNMRISLKYSEVFGIPWQGKFHKIHTFNFHAVQEAQF